MIENLGFWWGKFSRPASGRSDPSSKKIIHPVKKNLTHTHSLGCSILLLFNLALFC